MSRCTKLSINGSRSLALRVQVTTFEKRNTAVLYVIAIEGDFIAFRVLFVVFSLEVMLNSGMRSPFVVTASVCQAEARF